jgi:hypothetical protein
MATQLSYMQRMQVAEKTRERFVADAERALVELGGVVQDRLTTLMGETGLAREMQSRRDAWMLYQKLRAPWIDGTMKAWQQARKPEATKKKEKSDELALQGDGGLTLVGTDAVENKILASRMVMAVVEKVDSVLDDLRVRIKTLESRDDLEAHDILRPDVLILEMIEQWSICGMSRESWPMVAEVVQKLLIDRLKAAYTNANEFLIQQGVLPTIDLKDRVKRAPVGSRPKAAGPAGRQGPADTDSQPGFANTSGFGDENQGGAGYVGGGPAYGGAPQGRPGRAGAGGQPQGGNAGYGAGMRQAAPAVNSAGMPQGGHAPYSPQGHGPAPGPAARPPGIPGVKSPGGLFGGRLGWGNEAGVPAPPSRMGGPSAYGPAGQMPAQGTSSSQGGAIDETRLMTHATPLARSQYRAQGVIGQLKRLFAGQVGGAEFVPSTPQRPSAALAAAIAPRGDRGGVVYASGGTMYEDYSPAGVAKVAGQLREQTTELKKKAETKGEKATIEIVALMFQAILTEERIPPAIRVWFARLQMPVLRVALAEPDFFGTLNHPARLLIDRMGSCVMGFDAASINGSALELEIKRIVQVIEQYPETGKRVFQIVYDEFQSFLTKFLTGKEATKKVVSVAQQVEQKETLTIQYTIEMRNMLKDMPVRDELRTFLFKVWAEVLAVAAVRKGPQHAETIALKKSATELVWSASAKPNRNDRAKVIQDLPQLLQRLRAGMSLLGMSPTDQDAHIKIISDTMADAFMSKTKAVPQAQIEAMTKRLANLEDFVSEDGLGDLPLDAESIEMMLGIDASSIDVVTNGGSKPTPPMVAWAKELQPGTWFTLDHNGKVTQVQFVWRSDRKHLNLFAASNGHSYLIQAGRLAAYLQAGLLLPQEEETLTVRATRDALTKLEANPERLLGQTTK